MENKRILIVDDDVSLVKMYGQLLEKYGHSVYEATSIKAAHELLAKYRFDLCLCDMTLGLHSGMELLSYSPALQTSGTRFAVISGKRRYAELCQSIGVDFYLKPISNSDLLTLVEKSGRREPRPQSLPHNEPH
ncbi:MAG: response regulator [bacterium]|nr:response regulator [bacterium]